MTLQVIELKESDLDKVIELEKTLFVDSWTKEFFLDELNVNPYSNYFIIKDKDSSDIMGYIGFWTIFERAEITKIAINKKYQGIGLSKLLLADCEKRMKLAGCTSCSLEVRTSNVKAIGLYTKFGFKTLATRNKYYPNGEDAYLMYKEF